MLTERPGCQCQDTQAHFVERAFERLELADSLRSMLLSSFREVAVSIPIEVEHRGEKVLHTFKGCRVQHNHARGPFKGGLPGRLEATGHGIAHLTALVARDLSMEPARTRVAIQGFGNVGQNAAQRLANLGFTVIALSDSRGGVKNDEGIDVAAALEHKAEAGQLAGLSGAEHIEN